MSLELSDTSSNVLIYEITAPRPNLTGSLSRNPPSNFSSSVSSDYDENGYDCSLTDESNAAVTADDEDEHGDEDDSDYDPGYDPNDPDPTPDILGIYTGPEADAVLGRSHARWQDAVQAARLARPGEFPDTVFDLKSLLLRIPALPDSIPHNTVYLQGHSTWRNSDQSCSLRENIEEAHGFDLRSPRPFTVTISSSTSFQAWYGTPYNGIALLILGWAYILNATLAEKQNLLLQIHSFESPMTEASPSAPVLLDLSYATREEFAWWKALTARGTTLSADGLDGRFLPWSLTVSDLGGLDIIGRCDGSSSQKLPSASQAAAYLARFCSAYNLGSQCSAALAAVLCFQIHDGTKTRTVSVPKPAFSSSCLARVPSTRLSLPPEFNHLSYFMALGLSDHALRVVLESLLWEPDVPCNHAGHWLRPIRTILGPIVEANDHELLAKAIAFSSAKAAPLWLGTLLCGEYPGLLNAIDWYHWDSRMTVDVAAWTGVTRSFMALRPPGPYVRDGAVSRPDVWRLRRDLRHSYNKYEDDYTLEPLGPFCPFGTMRLKDIEIELHGHLNCSHQWTYMYWTWLYNSATDIGFSPGEVPLHPISEPPIEEVTQFAQYAEQYRGRADVRAIWRVSRLSTEWTFKWCGNQVEKGFTGHVVPPRRYDCQARPRSEDSTSSSVRLTRIREWTTEVGKAGVQDQNLVQQWGTSFGLVNQLDIYPKEI